MKVCLTGATGFVGNHVLNHFLNKKHKVFLILRNKNSLKKLTPFQKENTTQCFYDNSFRNIDVFFKVHKPKVVIHLASLFLSRHTSEDIEALVNSNLTFGLHILEAMNNNKINAFINTSTTWEHYNNENYYPVNLYAATKKSFESLLLYYIKCEDLKAITLKLYDSYGKGDTRKKLIPYLLTSIKNNELNLDMSEGNQEICLVHVEDIAKAYYIAFKKIIAKSRRGVYTTFFLDNGERYTIKSIVNIFQKQFNIKFNINWGALPYGKKEIFKPIKPKLHLKNWEPTKTFINEIDSLYE